MKILAFFFPWNILKEHLISGVDKLIAVSTRLSSQARLAGSARPNSTPLPALATPREEGSTWAGKFLEGLLYRPFIEALMRPGFNVWEIGKFEVMSLGPLSFRLGLIGLGSTGLGSFGLRSFGLVDHLD